MSARTERDASRVLRATAGGRDPRVPGRLHWIDWLRVIAIAGVFVYHTFRPFNTAGWHVKNAETSAALNDVTSFFDSFGLAILFLLAGAGVRFALEKRTWPTFLRERTARLMVPFVAGTILLSPFQGYLEASQQETFSGSYLAFFGTWLARLPGDLTARFSPTVFGVGYHLWFLGFLFAISVVALPLCLWLRTPRGAALIDAAARRCGWTGAALSAVIPIYVLMGIGSALGSGEHDWFEFTWYLAYFVLGFILIADERFMAAVRRDRWPALAVALVTTGLILAGIPAPLDSVGGEAGLGLSLVLGALFAVEGWAWTLVILNLGLRARRLQRPVSQHLGDAVLPVYVIHQPVILAVAFVVVQWPLGILPKWLAVFGLSVAITLAIVELALRAPLIRVLLGVRVRPTARTVAESRVIAGSPPVIPPARVRHARPH